MKRSKFTEAQIVFALRQAETGIKVEEVCRKMEITEATFYNWKKKYGGVEYNHFRPHSSLEGKTPEEVFNECEIRPNFSTLGRCF